jgi:hypothetical protein
MHQPLWFKGNHGSGRTDALREENRVSAYVSPNVNRYLAGLEQDSQELKFRFRPFAVKIE